MQFTTALLARLAMVALAAAFTGCVTNPETGRKQLPGLVSESEMTQLGLSSFDKMKKDMPISQDANANAMVRRVGERIKSVVNLPNAQWEFVVSDAKPAGSAALSRMITSCSNPPRRQVWRSSARTPAKASG